MLGRCDKLAYDLARFMPIPTTHAGWSHASMDTASRRRVYDPHGMREARPMTEAIQKDTVLSPCRPRSRRFADLFVFWGFGSGLAASKFCINFRTAARIFPGRSPR